MAVSYFCKLCGKELIINNALSRFIDRGASIRSSIGCPTGHYSLWLVDEAPIPRIEWIFISESVYLRYDWLSKRALVILENWHSGKEIDVGTINKLTSKSAKQWLKRLKNYVVYL